MNTKKNEVANILLRAAKATPIAQGGSVDPASRPDITLRGPAERPAGSKTMLTWTMIAPALGEMRGHPAGPFTLDVEVFDEIVANFVRRGRAPIVVDAEHQTEVSPPIEAPAKGWCHDLVNRGPAGLWGLVEWLSETRDDIQAGRYCGLSPALRYESADAKTGAPTGCRLSSIALTNIPYLYMMPALIAASDKVTLDLGVGDVHSGGPGPLRLPPRAACMAAVRAALEAHSPKGTSCGDLHYSAHALLASLDDMPTDGESTAMRLRDAEGQAASSTLLLRQANETIATQTEELVTLRDTMARITERDLVEEVDVAFRTHQDKLRYGPADRALLLSWRRSDPDGFRARHPRIDREHAHLLRDLVAPDPRPQAPQPEIDGPQLVQQLQRERGISLSDAQIEAASIQRARRRRAQSADEGGAG